MSKFNIPETLNDLDVDALLDLRSQAKKAAADLVKNENVDDEALAEAEQIVEFIDKTDARITELRDEASARDEKLDRIRAASKDEEEAEEEGDQPESDNADEEGPVDETSEEPKAEADEAEAEEPAEDKEKEEEKVAVAASGKTPSAAARAAANNPEPEAPAMSNHPITITAAADITGISAGSDLKDLTSVTAAAQARLKTFPTHRIGGQAGTRMRAGIATFNIGSARADGLVQGNPEYQDDMSLLTAASKESRLKGSSLTAAGGWCAPSDTLYDFCSEESTDGILDLPTVAAPRGSVRWTKGPDFSAIYENADGDWDFTEGQVVADEVKPCIEVECAPFNETTLGVTGVCIKAGILTQAAYPELVRRYTEAVLIAHQHKVASRIYGKIDAASTALSFTNASATAFDSLAQMEIAIEHMREKKRMQMGTTMEVLAPHWYKAIIRNDLARRNGVDLLAVTDQQINTYFAIRGASVQWLYNTGQVIGEGAGSDAAGVLSVPETVKLLMYPAGSFVKLTTDLITLDGVYDSTNLSTNTFTALFTEEGYEVVNMCGDPYSIEVSTCMSGQTGAAALTDCLVGQASA